MMAVKLSKQAGRRYIIFKADLPISQGPSHPSKQVTHKPEIGAGSTRVVVIVAALRFGLLNDMISPFLYFR